MVTTSRRSRWLIAALLAVVVLRVVELAGAVRQGAFVGGRTAADFLCFWIAARGAVQGQAGALYDWAQMLPMIQHSLGHEFVGFVPWMYPPSALVVLSPLALLPLAAAHAAWALVTLVAFLLVLHRIAGLAAVVIAVAAPLTVPEIAMGQNGFATAAALGLSLLLWERRSLQAGLVAGLLTCKPQLFLLLPVMALLRRDNRWIIGMTISSGLLAIVSAGAFGAQAWIAFFQSLHANASAFGQGAVAWSALQSPYALARAFGLGSHPAIMLHAMVCLGVLLIVIRIDGRARSPLLRHAAICAGTILVTPYVLVWDLPIIGLGAAFLAAALKRHDVAPVEAAGLVWLVGSTTVFFRFGVPVGTLDGLTLLALVWRRCGEARSCAWSTLPPAAAAISG